MVPSFVSIHPWGYDTLVTNSVNDLRDVLKAANLRATAQRIAVMGVLRDSPGHFSVDEIGERVRERLGTVSLQTVYDTLDALTTVGLARRIEPAGRPALFEGRVGDNHHHVVCRRCGAVEDIDCATASAPCVDAANTAGFVLDQAEITFWGLCPDCHDRSD